MLRQLGSTLLPELDLLWFLLLHGQLEISPSSNMLMKPGSSSFFTSLVTALLHSGVNILYFCCTGLHSELTLKWCCMIFLSIPDICLCFQAKTSWFPLKKETIFSFSRVRSADPIFNTFVKSPRTISTSYAISDSSGIGSGSLIAHMWFSPYAKATW